MAYIRKRGTRYYFTIWTKSNGNIIRHEYAGGTSRSEAEKAYRKFMIETDRSGKYFEPSEMLFGLFLEEWIEKYVVHYMKPNTIDSYTSTIKNHIIPKFGNFPLSEITTAVLQDWIIELKNTYSKSTVKTIMSCLRSALRWAVANRNYLSLNPMDNVKLPPYRSSFNKIKIFSNDDITAIFEKFPYGHQIHMPCTLAYYTGMRLGECLALLWDNIDMDNRTIRITGTIYDKNGIPKIMSTKTKSSTRTISFGSKLYNELKNHKVWQEKNRLKYGSKYKLNNFVCTMKNGKPMTSNNIKYFNMWCRDTFGYGSFHSFRHTHASLLLEHGLPLDYVSKRLGHSSIYTTANVYDTITDKREQEAVDKMESFL